LADLPALTVLSSSGLQTYLRATLLSRQEPKKKDMKKIKKITKFAGVG
jgi:hypothetical protein